MCSPFWTSQNLGFFFREVVSCPFPLLHLLSFPAAFELHSGAPRKQPTLVLDNLISWHEVLPDCRKTLLL